MSMRDADIKDVAKFMGVPVHSVQEDLDAMSPKLYSYMEELFAKWESSSDHG